jgi:hypothetical protein
MITIRASLRFFLLLSVLFTSALFALAAPAGKGGVVKGRVTSSFVKTPSGVLAAIPSLGLESECNSDGTFTITNVAAGNHFLVISGAEIRPDTFSITVSDGEITNMGNIEAKPGDVIGGDKIEIPTITLDDMSGQDDDNSTATSQSTSGFYVGNQDDFLYTAAVVFGPFRFRPRGYDNSDVLINGIPLQDLETGYASFSLIGGLNDVMKNRTMTYGLRPAENSFGTVKGSTYISATAADQRKGTHVSYQLSNGTNQNRIMLTHNSGQNKKGWAFSLSGSRRWAKEGYIPGTFYDGYSFYGAVSKSTKKGQFNLTTFGTPNRRGRATSEIDEVFEVTGNHYYNSAWGYQNGEKRSALVNNLFEPSVIANYTHRPSDKLRWNTSLGYQFGYYKRSNIDFYNGANPSPTYYRNLPYYYLYGVTNPSQAAASALTAQYQQNPDLLQIQWDRLYNSNYINTQTINDVDGIAGNNVTGKRSIYVLRDEVNDKSKISFNSNVTYAATEDLTLDGGVIVVSQKDEYYKQITDLLGGDFFVNYNQFAAQQNPGVPSYVQNDINKPNQIIKKGDKYGYDYIMRALDATVWAQGKYSISHLDVFAAAEYGNISFNREGLMRNGLFLDNSFGKSPTHNFSVYRTKAGLTYKIDARNAVYINAGYFNDAPRIDYAYISARTRDYVVDGIKPYTTKTMEAGYSLRSSLVNMRITGYATDVVGNTLIKRFWNDDPAFQSFVNYIMQDVNTRSIGTEFVANVKISSRLSATGVAAVGQSFYTNRPAVSIYQDNIPSNTPIVRDVYLKNYYLGVGPQSIYSLALKYATGKSWFFNLSGNFMDRNYIEVNPDKHTQLASDMVDPASKQWNDIYSQERLPSAYVVNASIGKSADITKWYKGLKRRTMLNVNLSVNNLLNNTNIKLNGYEQLRYDFPNQNPYKFPNKYSYAYGLNYYLTIGIWF